MAIVLKELLKKIDNKDMVLLGGKGGLDKVVTWSHMVENQEISDFLEGGEIAFSTGIALGKDLKLIDLVKSVYNNSASAMVINIGPYISQIDEDVIKFANNNDFPIFSVPWDIHMARIMRIISYEISMSEKNTMELEAALYNAVKAHLQPELYMEQLNEKGWNTEGYYQAVIYKVHGNFSEKNLENCKNSLNMYGLSSVPYAQAFRINDELVLVFADTTENDMMNVLEHTGKRIQTLCGSSNKYTCTAGSSVQGIINLYKSYEQAAKMQKLHNLIEADNSVLQYDSLGIYKILLAVQESDILDSYCQETLTPLIKYDNYHGTDLCEVVRSYLKHNGSIKDVSEELFVHRNTINNKVRKAEEILNMSFADWEARTRIMLAYMITDMQRPTIDN